MKSFKACLLILSLAFLASCSGITDTQIAEEEFYPASDSSQIMHQENGDFFNSGDQEDIIDVRPPDRYKDRP